MAAIPIQPPVWNNGVGVVASFTAATDGLTVGRYRFGDVVARSPWSGETLSLLAEMGRE